MGDCIVDACILKSAGPGAHADSVACREVLESLLSEKHVVLVDRHLLAEWMKHLSSFASTWLSTMLSRGAINLCVGAAHHRTGIEAAISHLPAAQQPVALKDAHILTLGVTAGSLVISSERRCRAAFVKCGQHYPPIQGVYWASPLIDLELQDVIHLLSPPPFAWLLV